MTSQPSSPTQSRKKSIVINDPPKFDLEGYLQNYRGRTRLERLILIGTSSTFLGTEALKLAANEAKTGKDTRRYVEIVRHLQIIAPDEKEAVLDEAWVETQNKVNAVETARLEQELKGYKNNLVKESIRMANQELGKHYQAKGDLPKAFEAYSRMRQDVSVAKHIIEVSRHLIEVAMEQRNTIAVTSNIAKIKGVSQAAYDDDKTLQPFLAASDGLAQMIAGEYNNAAISFLSTNPGLTSNNCGTIVSPNDIAVYGGLLSLATMDRNQLQKKVLENSNFRNYLELEPHIRRAITFFVNSRYSSCLEILESYRSDYLLDIYLQKHVDDIYHLIRSKSIVQYFIPFSCVTLDSLNEAFATPGKPIEKELSQMISRKELDARIDTQNRLLTSVPKLPRANLQSSTLAAAREYEREAHRRIQHMNISGCDLELRGGKKLPNVNVQFPNQSYEEEWDPTGLNVPGMGFLNNTSRNLRSSGFS